MSMLKTLCIAVIFSSFVACNSAERKAYKSQVKANESQTELNERKMEISKDYEKCVKKSDTADELAKCEAMLKGAQAL